MTHMESIGVLKSLPEIDRYMRFLRLLTPQVSTTPDFGQSVDVPNIFFVDATNGSDNNSGKDPAFAKATIQAAINLTVSDRGDIVFIMPGSYAENLTLTSKNYVALVGALLPGYARPDVVPATGVALDINTSQGTVLIGMRFYSADADVVLEGFRPGVVKRLGVDHETLSAENPRLVYCSISGYGQTGPMRDTAGHDINYISYAGVLGACGRKGVLYERGTTRLVAGAVSLRWARECVAQRA